MMWLGFGGVWATVVVDLAAQTAPAGGGSAPATELPETLDAKLVGNRFRPLEWAEMTEAQKTMTRHVLDGPRTTMSGPFNVMLYEWNAHKNAALAANLDPAIIAAIAARERAARAQTLI